VHTVHQVRHVQEFTSGKRAYVVRGPLCRLAQVRQRGAEAVRGRVRVGAYGGGDDQERGVRVALAEHRQERSRRSYGSAAECPSESTSTAATFSATRCGG
jgi:hypothetical protein